MGKALIIFAVLIAVASGVAGEQYDPRADFCRRFSHEGLSFPPFSDFPRADWNIAAVLGDRLYINGGQLNLAGKGGKNFTSQSPQSSATG